jgi:hypothetical protein
MMAFAGFAAASAVVWTEDPSRLSRLMGAQSQQFEVIWPPTAETPDANAIHGEIAGAGTGRGVGMARGR